ncbi:MAG TPA: bifunctional phosphopantothenoylcysteine decarboxylase/phosphopantothenate--cysteine ligase CoaBC, partial [Nitrospirae bacterium]|nr:bifunctional phosphopantothenoylcysteine decarboxylase/phosphopantothenate--cysteine ligase CoaBC [Nitrospirota bacterium]
HPFAHIELPKSADAIIVAPATANTLSKFYSASASDMVSSCFLSFSGPVIIAPAMNWRMYTDPIFQERLNFLKDRGVIEVVPEKGNLACGETGIGKMASVEKVIAETKKVLSENDLTGRSIVVTAGPTREYIDPVRFISNRSSGRMGFAIAEHAFYRGADVTLISGPSSLEAPYGVNTEFVETAKEMLDSVKKNTVKADVLIMAAAVADYSPKHVHTEKIDKSEGLDLRLIPAIDIIKSISALKKKPLIVGFAAETGDRKDRAREKLRQKGMDMIVFNNVSLSGAGFDVDTNEVTLIDEKSEASYPLMTKGEVARKIIDKISGMLT